MSPKALTLIRQVWKSLLDALLAKYPEHMPQGIPPYVIQRHVASRWISFMFVQVIKVPDDELSLVVLASEGIEA